MNNVQKSLEKNQHVTKLVSYEDCTKLCEKKKNKDPCKPLHIFQTYGLFYSRRFQWTTGGGIRSGISHSQQRDHFTTSELHQEPL